ncbi:MAG: DUF4173 domain-containing protein [Syntrophomonadaceae bacterium]|nr:DUF4173 domain-containing protein [Syntrophomonadaceae bacterium]
MNDLSSDNRDVALTSESEVLNSSGDFPAEEISLQQKVKIPFTADIKDSYFALFAFILGFIFARLVLFTGQGWGVSLFTLLYCSSVTVYLLKKGIHIPRAGWFWLAVVMVIGLSYALWSNNGLAPWQGLLLFGSAVYWILSATGLLILGKTSNLLLLDAYRALFAIPFGNFGCQYKSLALLVSNKRTRGKELFSIFLGLFLTFIVMIIVFPLLMEADSGGFARIVEGIAACFTFGQGFWETFWQLILAVPIAAYIFGLVAGSAHKRGTDMSKEDTILTVSAFQILPMTTVYILLGLLCTLYMVFIGSQVPYFFSAFVGQRPEGWQVYSEYARSGFFELCGIAFINLIVLTAANVMSQKQRSSSLALKILNALLAVLTLVLITTAFSKMALYIGAYGLSMRRLLPCVFMIFMAVICGGIIALQKWQFSITRLAVGTGIIMFCILCLFNPDSYVARYNADRYLSGTLKNFDVEILYRSGPAGVAPALMVYERTDDQALQADLEVYLLAQKKKADKLAGKPGDSVERAQARDKVSESFAANK